MFEGLKQRYNLTLHYCTQRCEKEYHKPQRLELMTQQHMPGSLLINSRLNYHIDVQ